MAEYWDTDYFSKSGMDLDGNRTNDGSMQGGRNNNFTIDPDWEDEEVDWLKKAASKRDEATKDTERDNKSMVDRWLNEGMQASDVTALQGVMKSLLASIDKDNKEEDGDSTDTMRDLITIYYGATA